jgi:hypothetical protein
MVQSVNPIDRTQATKGYGRKVTLSRIVVSDSGQMIGKAMPAEGRYARWP